MGRSYDGGNITQLKEKYKTPETKGSDLTSTFAIAIAVTGITLGTIFKDDIKKAALDVQDKIAQTIPSNKDITNWVYSLR